METLVSSDVDRAAALLSAGQVVAIPTETVYGLAANALDEEAVQKVFRLKNRPASDPLILHVRDAHALDKLGIETPYWAVQLMERFWPGPLTLLLPRGPHISPTVTAGLPRVAVRAPAHPLVQTLLQKVSFPLAAPSANPFGRTSPTTPAHVYAYFAGQIPLILDGGPCSYGLESTIIGEEEGRFVLYRPGALPRELLEEVLGERLVLRSSGALPQSPGQFLRHYAPAKPLLYGWKTLPDEPSASLVYFTPPADPPDHPHLHILSPDGRLDRAAMHLYETILRCEAEPTDFILVQRLPTLGLGEALHDRLRRAAAQAFFLFNHPLEWTTLASLLRRYEIQVLLDVRRHTVSRHYPHLAQGPLQKALAEIGVLYEWQPVLSRLPFTLQRLRREYAHIALFCVEADTHKCISQDLAARLESEGYALFVVEPEGRLYLHQVPTLRGKPT
ncbi:MAG: threonylcarbamoyl-AMP synthase [Bacteroidetes bacterium]|nr:MAG: threonylcarbamoyl-AMP synthase [Bacteroidota bacterium]